MDIRKSAYAKITQHMPHAVALEKGEYFLARPYKINCGMFTKSLHYDENRSYKGCEGLSTY